MSSESDNSQISSHDPQGRQQRYERRYYDSKGHTLNQPPVRPTRDNLVRNYDAQGASRARNARMYAQEAMQDFQAKEQRARERAKQREMIQTQRRKETGNQTPQSDDGHDRRGHNAQETRRPIRPREQYERKVSERPAKPMTTQESHNRALMSREAYEAARATRDVLSSSRTSRTSNREIIDGRGSIDSRAFNEKNELVGYSINAADKPEPAIDASNPTSKWKSQAGEWGTKPGNNFFANARSRSADLSSLSDTISGKASYSSRGGFSSEVPISIKLLIALIAVLLIVLLVILFT